jgi:Raf kinase inhibitor-like YbhB/YbcL family protein
LASSRPVNCAAAPVLNCKTAAFGYIRRMPRQKTAAQGSFRRNGVLAIAGLAGVFVTAAVMSAPPSAFKIAPDDPKVGPGIPDVYTAKAFGCTGGNQSPALHWSGAPADTKSFVVTLFDKDERSTPSGWWHWEVYDLPKDTKSLPMNAGAVDSSSLPKGALEGRTDLGEDAYHGPCPAAGDPPHRYVFTVYALNVEKLPVPKGSSGGMVTSIVSEHVISKAVFTAHYGRPKEPAAKP